MGYFEIGFILGLLFLISSIVTILTPSLRLKMVEALDLTILDSRTRGKHTDSGDVLGALATYMFITASVSLIMILFWGLVLPILLFIYLYNKSNKF